MADLIDRAALLEDVAAAEANSGMGYVVASTLRRYVKRLPAVDAVEVVRCGECVYGIADGMICGGVGFLMPGHATFPDHFCNFGERRTDATD